MIYKFQQTNNNKLTCVSNDKLPCIAELVARARGGAEGVRARGTKLFEVGMLGFIKPTERYTLFEAGRVEFVARICPRFRTSAPINIFPNQP